MKINNKAMQYIKAKLKSLQYGGGKKVQFTGSQEKINEEQLKKELDEFFIDGKGNNVKEARDHAEKLLVQGKSINLSTGGDTIRIWKDLSGDDPEAKVITKAMKDD